MPKLPLFRSPAEQARKDLASSPDLLAELEDLWNTNLNGFTQLSILGNPWTNSNDSNSTHYFNPLDTDVQPPAHFAPIQWNAMPGRIAYYNQNDWKFLTQEQMYELADTGYYTDGQGQKHSFPNITTDPCTGDPVQLPYGPYGPRGWQDEYCEWSVLRDQNGKILRVHFTCENPEYWFSLWRVSPETVLALYQQVLGNSGIQMEDLYLKDPVNGSTVIDPSTGKPAYDPLNQWNLGPISTPSSGGAMHLTSTPNTLPAEITLAGAATIQRKIGNSDPAQLICCSQYGQPYRNSDPHIGQVTNQVVGSGTMATLADPPGLYIQTPDFSQYKLPANAPAGKQPSDYWTVARGTLQLNDQFGNPLPGNLILHAVFEVPAEDGFTVSDITIGGQNIQYAAQIAATFSMQLNAMAVSADVPPGQDCVGSPATPFPQPLQLFHTSIWDATYNTNVPNPVGSPMSLASNMVAIPPVVQPNTQNVPLTLTCLGVQKGPNGELPQVVFSGGGITVRVLALTENLNYAAPGDDYPQTVQALTLSVDVSPSAQPGEVLSVTIVNSGASAGPAAPAFLKVGAA